MPWHERIAVDPDTENFRNKSDSFLSPFQLAASNNVSLRGNGSGIDVGSSGFGNSSGSGVGFG